MKNKILSSVIITVLFAILIVTSSFMMLINLEEIKNTKQELRNINYLISKMNNVIDISQDDYKHLKELNNLKILII